MKLKQLKLLAEDMEALTVGPSDPHHPCQIEEYVAKLHEKQRHSWSYSDGTYDANEFTDDSFKEFSDAMDKMLKDANEKDTLTLHPSMRNLLTMD